MKNISSADAIREKVLNLRDYLSFNGFILLVIAPTVIVSIYYLFIAADIYVSEAKFTVETSDAAPSIALGGGDVISSVLGGGDKLKKLYVVKEFIYSNDMVKKLDEAINLRVLYNNKNSDVFSRLGAQPSHADYLDYFKNKVSIRIDEHSGIIFFKVHAFSPDDAKLIASEIIKISEQFVNNMSSTMKDDAIAFSSQELENAEKKMLEQNEQISKFRNKNKNYNPHASTVTVMQNTASLESQLNTVETEIAELQNYMQANSPKLVILKNRADALKKQIEGQGSKLANERGSALALLSQNYTTLELSQQFSLRRYEIAAVQLEAAQVEARKKSVYLLRIENPVSPDSAVEPQRLKEIITIFITFLIIYVMARVAISSIIDHIRK